MGNEASSKRVSRRSILKAGAAMGALQVASPFILSARGETPIKLGMVDPLTGVYAAVARGEVDGAHVAVADINKNGGIMGRPVELLVEDSANNVRAESTDCESSSCQSRNDQTGTRFGQ